MTKKVQCLISKSEMPETNRVTSQASNLNCWTFWYLENSDELIYMMQPISCKYDVEFPGSTGRFSHSVSQVVKGGETDRFAFRIGQEVGPPSLPVLARFSAHLFFDEDRREIVSEPLIISIPGTSAIGPCTIGPVNNELLRLYKAQIAAFARLPGKEAQAPRSN